MYQSIWKIKTDYREAVEKGDIDALKGLLRKAPGFINCRYQKGLTPLHLASKLGRHKIAKMLIKADADLNAETMYHISPLHLAFRQGHLEIAFDLMEAGADLSLRDHNNYAPLHAASSRFKGAKLLEILQVLEEAGADLNSRGHYQQTLLMEAAGYDNNLELLQFLIGKNVDLDEADKSGRTALMLAAEQGHYRAAKLLLEAGAKVDKKTVLNLRRQTMTHRDKMGWTALFFAVEGGHIPLVYLLLARGADPNLQCRHLGDYTLENADELGQTPLHIAATKGYESIIEILEEAGGDINLADMKGVTPAEIIGEQKERQRGAQESEKENSLDSERILQIASQSDSPKKEEWEEMVSNHKEFLSQKSTGGKWKILVAAGLPVAVYQSQVTKKEKQLNQPLLNLSDLDLKRSKLPSIGLPGCYGPGQDFRESDLSNSALTDSHLPKANFQKSHLKKTDFSRSNLRDAIFVDADLEDGDFEKCNLQGADFTGAIIDGINLRGSNFRQARGFDFLP